RQRQYLVNDLVRRLGADGNAARRAVRLAQAGVEDAQIVVDLGDGADRRARAFASGLLLDADGRRQAADVFDLGLLHLPQELPGVGRQRFDVAALALGVDGVQSERAFARAAGAAADSHTVAGQGDVDVLEVVLLGALDYQVRERLAVAGPALSQRRFYLPAHFAIAPLQHRSERLPGVRCRASRHL